MLERIELSFQFYPRRLQLSYHSHLGFGGKDVVRRTGIEP